MITPVMWDCGEPCPDCGTTLTLLDNGSGPIRLDCGSCGYACTGTVNDLAGGKR